MARYPVLEHPKNILNILLYTTWEFRVSVRFHVEVSRASWLAEELVSGANSTFDFGESDSVFRTLLFDGSSIL